MGQIQRHFIRQLSTKKSGLSSALSASVKNNSHFFVTPQKLSKKALKELPTHELLQKLGFIRQPNAGLVHWLPLGLATLRSLEEVIHFRMREIDAMEVSLSSLSNQELWERTGRWSNSELFKLVDAKDKNFCLVPTCEEEITKLVGDDLISYKNLPMLVYQITRKYRDERRPRAGLLRGREFLMKDAYSFHLDSKSALEMFYKVNEAYRRIFTDLKVPFVSAKADSGDIGGDLSLEWHYLHENGEDTLFTCSNCGNVSNVEKCTSFAAESSEGEVSVQYFTNPERDTLVCAYYPAERTISPAFVKAEIPDIDLSLRDQDEVLSYFKDDDESSFLTKSIVRIMDARLHDRSNFPDFEVPYHRGTLSTLTGIPIVEAQEGEICGECEEGVLMMDRAIEVGHTFYLGDRYSKPLEASVVNEAGETQDLMMGCYGIGVSRLIAAIVEMTRDDIGLCWPAVIAPYQATFIVAPGADPEETSKHVGIMDVIANSLIAAPNGEERLRVQKDLRPDVSFGRKLMDSKSLGIPLQVIIGKNYPMVEIEVRGKRHSGSDDSELQALHRSIGENYQWEISRDEKLGERHKLHIDGLSDIIRALLKDL